MGMAERACKKKKKWMLPYLNHNYIAVGCLDTNHVKSLGVSEVEAETQIPFVTVSCVLHSICRTKLLPHWYQFTTTICGQNSEILKPHWSLKHLVLTVKFSFLPLAMGWRCYENSKQHPMHNNTPILKFFSDVIIFLKETSGMPHLQFS